MGQPVVFDEGAHLDLDQPDGVAVDIDGRQARVHLQLVGDALDGGAKGAEQALTWVSSLG
jgi:hypothetical protein